MVVANIFNHNLQTKELNIIPIDKKLNSFLYCIFYQLTTPVWDINSTDMSSITTLIDMDMDMEDIESTDGVSILSDDLLQSEDSNTVIAVDSDEEIYSDDDEHEDEYVIDNIFREECEFLDSEKVDGKHYIGLCRYFPTHKLLLYANAIRPATLYKHPYSHTLSYLQLYSVFRVYKPSVDIMQLCILTDSTYTVILKTYWLRLIQRTWKAVIQTRKIVMKKRMNLHSIRLFEVSGKYPADATYMPTLKGMLYTYSRPYIANNSNDYLFSECH